MEIKEFLVCNRNTFSVFGAGYTLDRALKMIDEFEMVDEKEGQYVENNYCICIDGLYGKVPIYYQGIGYVKEIYSVTFTTKFGSETHTFTSYDEVVEALACSIKCEFNHTGDGFTKVISSKDVRTVGFFNNVEEKK